jgi:hypothetical protein
VPRRTVSRTPSVTPTHVAPQHVAKRTTAPAPARRLHRRARRAKHPAAAAPQAPHIQIRVGHTLGAEATKTPAVSVVSTTTGDQQRRLFIVGLLAVSCIVLAFSALPPRRLPWRVAWAIEDRRVEILVGGVAAFVTAVAAIFWMGG